MEKVEIIKIGEITPGFKPESGQILIMIIEESTPTISHYLNKLKSAGSGKYTTMSTKGIIRPSGDMSSMFSYGGPLSYIVDGENGRNIIGIPDHDPIIGDYFSINGGLWSTTTIKEIIDNDIIITKNSVYAIHSVSRMRSNALKNLGL